MGGVTQKWWVQTLFFDRGTCYTLSLSSQQWFCLMYRLFEHVAHLAKPLCIFLKPPFQEKHVVFKFATKQNSFFYTQETFTNKAACTQEKPFKQTSSYTQETFQTRQFLHTASLSNKAVFKHNKPSNKAVFGFIRLSNKAAFTHQQALK